MRIDWSVAGLSTIAAFAGIGLALYLYMGERSEVSLLERTFKLEGAERLTDPQWVAQLERVGWISAVNRTLRGAGLGFLVSLVGLVLGLVSLILSLPLLILSYITPLASTALLMAASGRGFSWSIALAAALIIGAAIVGTRS